MIRNSRTFVVAIGVLALIGVGAWLGGATGALQASQDDTNTQVAALYQLQSSFHGAATLRDPNDVDERIADMLSIWAEDGSLTLGPNTFSGLGEPGTDSCEPDSGTICAFFSYVAPPFQNRWISLAPSYATHIEVDGNTATIEFECHYFDEEWTSTAKLGVAATAVKSGNDWVFSSAVVTPLAPPGIPYP